MYGMRDVKRFLTVFTIIYSSWKLKKRIFGDLKLSFDIYFNPKKKNVGPLLFEKSEQFPFLAFLIFFYSEWPFDHFTTENEFKIQTLKN